MYVGLCEMQVKVVRDLMNQMIDAWKQVSEASFVDENSLVDDSRSPPKGIELVLIVLCM